mmetsp:Transcript_12822/g.12821  ORF Transcript_12822/g.12821 Transcript_12822/m.12821 type:complete len:113 (+) Transcript_12822:1799-2137(+)
MLYSETCSELPSSKMAFSLRKSSNPENDGRINFKYHKTSELEQINESEEISINDDIEEYNLSQFNMKDTLLTVEDIKEGESEDYDTNSDTSLSCIKKESQELKLSRIESEEN